MYMRGYAISMKLLNKSGSIPTRAEARSIRTSWYKPWVIHHLEIIGEAIRTIPQDFRNLHPEISWRQIYGMRNILVHHYFGINLDQVWTAVEHDLPVLKSSVDALLAGQEGTSST